MKIHFLKKFIICLFLVNLCSAEPVITQLNPPFGHSSGGNHVTITGRGFTGATAVNFGAIPAASFIVNSDTSLTAVTPPHCPQVTHVTITTKETSSGNAFFTFKGNWPAYVTNPEKNSVSVINTVNNIVIKIHSGWC